MSLWFNSWELRFRIRIIMFEDHFEGGIIIIIIIWCSVDLGNVDAWSTPSQESYATDI